MALIPLAYWTSRLLRKTPLLARELSAQAERRAALTASQTRKLRMRSDNPQETKARIDTDLLNNLLCNHFARPSLEVDKARRAELVPKIEQLSVGEGAGAVEAQFLELFAERKDSEEVKLGLGSAMSRIKVKKVRVSEDRRIMCVYGAARSKAVTLYK